MSVRVIRARVTKAGLIPGTMSSVVCADLDTVLEPDAYGVLVLSAKTGNGYLLPWSQIKCCDVVASDDAEQPAAPAKARKAG